MTKRNLATKIVDVHAHAVIPEALELVGDLPAAIAAREREALMLGDSAARQSAMVREAMPLLEDLDRRLDAMDRAGVDVQLVSPSPAHYHDWASLAISERVGNIVNEGVAALCAGSPERLVGLGLASLHEPDLATSLLEDAVTRLKLRGVVISTGAPGMELSDPRLESLWRRAEELGALIFIHPWGCSLGERLDQFFLYNVVGQPVETTVALSHLVFSGVFDRYPTLRVLAAHGGGYFPYYPGRGDHARRVRPELTKPARAPSTYAEHLYFDSLVHSPEVLATLIAHVGARRVLMGSDFPFDMGTSDPVASIDALANLSKADRRAILGATALSLLGLE